MIASVACSAVNPAYETGGDGEGSGGGGTLGTASTLTPLTTDGADGDTALSSTGGDGGTTITDPDDGTDSMGSGLDTESETDSPPPVVSQCPGVLWAINDSGDLRLVNFTAMTTTSWATLPIGAWAAATLRNGQLLLVEHMAPATAHLFDLVGDEAVELALGVRTNAEMSRATTDDSGKVWLATSDSGQMWLLDVDAPLATEPVTGPDMGTVSAGDHAFLADGTLLIVGFEGVVALVNPIDMTVISDAGGLGTQGPADFTGVVVFDDGDVVISDVTGDIYRLNGGPQVGWEVEFLYSANGGIDDLAPVRAAVGQCPES